MNALHLGHETFSIDMYLFLLKFLKITYRCQDLQISKGENTCIVYEQQTQKFLSSLPYFLLRKLLFHPKRAILYLLEFTEFPVKTQQDTIRGDKTVNNFSCPEYK